MGVQGKSIAFFEPATVLHRDTFVEPSGHGSTSGIGVANLVDEAGCDLRSDSQTSCIVQRSHFKSFQFFSGLLL